MSIRAKSTAMVCQSIEAAYRALGGTTIMEARARNTEMMSTGSFFSRPYTHRFSIPCLHLLQ